MAKPKKSPRASICEALRRLLPDPVREEKSGEDTTLVAGDPGLVAIRLTDSGLTVSLYGVRWDGPHTPVPDHRPLAEAAWADFGGHEAEAVVAAHLLVQAAIILRRAAFRRCKFCQKNTPPEWWHGEDACQGCAERHLDVVHWDTCGGDHESVHRTIAGRARTAAASRVGRSRSGSSGRQAR